MTANLDPSRAVAAIGERAVSSSLCVRPLFLPGFDPCMLVLLIANRYRAIGRIMVKCLLEGRRIGSRLAPSVFKFLTGTEPTLRDLQVNLSTWEVKRKKHTCGDAECQSERTVDRGQKLSEWIEVLRQECMVEKQGY